MIPQNFEGTQYPACKGGVSMKILFFGDIFGRPGREAIKKILPIWKRKYASDFIIANAENLAHGKSVTKETLKEILGAGIDFLTSGNHIWEKPEALQLLKDKKNPLIRPANYPPGLPGDGWRVVNVGKKKVLVIALVGRVFMHINPDDPLRKADEIIKNFYLGKSSFKKNKKSKKLDAIIIDFHAEISSEKKVLGWYLDGRVSAVLGTHTHVQTSDERILPKGTVHISDVGFVGPYNSILGIPPENSIELFLTQMHAKIEPAEGPVEVNAVLVEINNKTGLADNIKKLREIVEI